jgi:hypothetical protein
VNIQALLSEKVSQALIAAGAPADCEPQVRYLLCKLSRRHAQFFGDSHHAVGLIVTELNFC